MSADIPKETTMIKLSKKTLVPPKKAAKLNLARAVWR